MPRIDSTWPIAPDCAPVIGSTIAAKPRPMALPIVSPATSAEASPICTAKPSARPTSASPITVAIPATEAMLPSGSANGCAPNAAMPTARLTTKRN